MDQEHKNAITQNKLKQLKSSSLVAFYNLHPGNGAGLFSKKMVSWEVDK